MIRRSRCVHVTIIVVILQVAVILLLHKADPRSLISLDQIPFRLGELVDIFSEKDAYSFNLWVDKIFGDKLKWDPGPNPENSDEIEEDKKRLRLTQYSYNASTDPSDPLVNIPDFIKDDEQNPHLLPFNPKFTLGLILHDINKKGIKDADQPYKLPIFHWGDWSDITELHPHLLSFGESRSNCMAFVTRKPRKTRKNPNPVVVPPKWCIDDSVVTWTRQNEELSQYFDDSLLEIQKSPYRTGFHIHAHGARSTKQLKKLEGASYLNDFMPKPLSVVFLVPHLSGQLITLQLDVTHDAGSRQRLVDSDLAREVALDLDVIDLRQELDVLGSSVSENHNSNFEYSKTLVHENFVDNLEQVILELSGRNDLSPLELNYLRSLQLSVEVERPTKYFYEPQLLRSIRNWAYGGHYDWRFFKEIINFTELEKPSLHALTQAWLRFTNSNNLVSWIAHGSLLSWYWNGITFPWDADVDVQMPVTELHKLARKFNQSVIVDFGPDVNGEVKTGRFFLDCGTWISHRQMGNGLNNIDARFIDMDTGLYIDITGLAVSNSFGPARYDELLPKSLARPIHEKSGKPVRGPDDQEVERNNYLHLYNCRNNHYSTLEEILPLTLSYYEGVPAWIPKGYVAMLEEEYKEQGLIERKFKNYVFLPRLRLWVETQFVSDFMTSIGNDFKPILKLGSHRSKASSNVDKLSVYSMSDDNYLELMARDTKLLTEYISTRAVTEKHEAEMRKLLKGQSSEEEIFEDGKLRSLFPSFRRGFLHYKRFMDGYDFERQVSQLMTDVNVFRQGQSALAVQATQDEPAPQLEPVAVSPQLKPGEILFQTPEHAAKQPKRPEAMPQ